MTDETTPRLQIQLDEETAQGRYANLMMITHSDTEFVLDFLFVQPQQPAARVRSRVITSPRNAKQLMLALAENVRAYERRHGVIPLPTPPGETNLH